MCMLLRHMQQDHSHTVPLSQYCPFAKNFMSIYTLPLTLSLRLPLSSEGKGKVSLCMQQDDYETRMIIKRYLSRGLYPEMRGIYTTLCICM